MFGNFSKHLEFLKIYLEIFLSCGKDFQQVQNFFRALEKILNEFENYSVQLPPGPPSSPPPSHHTQSDYIVLCFQLCRCYIMLKFIYSENTKATPALSSKPVMGKMTSQSATFPRITLYQLPILPAFLPRAESIKESYTLESSTLAISTLYLGGEGRESTGLHMRTD